MTTPNIIIIPSELQAQLEAQAQLQAELQAQLQGQGQGQHQGEHQSQSQYQDSSNSNCNVNGNVNYDANCNDNANCNVNANYNTSVTSVCVDVKVSDEICQTPQQSAPDIDLSCLDASGYGNIIMPEDSYQYINGGGDGAYNTLFHLDQVNNLVNNGSVSGVTATSTISSSGSMSGGSVTPGTNTATASDFSQSLDHAGSSSIDGIAQSITLGANVQINQLTFTGHDSAAADHVSGNIDNHHG